MDFSLYTGPIQAFGGNANAGAGTVYLRTASQGVYEGTLIIDNSNMVNTAKATDINSNVTDTAVGNVIIRNGGCLRMTNQTTLIVGGIWSNGAGFDSQVGSQVIFAGNAASTSTVYGSNTFMGLICTNTGGKTILFEAGKTNSVAALGQLTLKGSATATNLILRSTVDGTAWKLNVNGAANQSVRYVDVKNSDASLGAPVGAFGSIDRGGNPNWIFGTAPGQTNRWTGVNSTAWNLGANWSLGHPPIAEEFVLIPFGCPRYPVLDTAKTFSGLEIQNGASLILAGNNLTLTANAMVAGALTASNAETIVFQGDVSFAGGIFTQAYSTISFAGAGGQFVNLADLTFYKVNVANTNTVAFTNGFSAYELICKPSSNEMRSMVFERGKTVSFYGLELLSAIGTTNIGIRSSAAGQQWRLAVSGAHSVRGVDVQDSNASIGKTIYASGSRNSGNNNNWNFGANWAEWTGQAGDGQFGNSTNWWPAVVPDASSRVRVEAPIPMTITGAVTLLDLIVGGGFGAAAVTVNAPLAVTENMTTLNNGTLTLNRPCIVGNNMNVLEGGMMTHSANTQTEIAGANKLDVTVYGSVNVDVNAAINVTSKGGYGANNGPGSGSSGSYGGCGTGWVSEGTNFICYGSIIAPTNLGSGGNGNNSVGGGAIRLRVSGTIRNDGLMCADAIPGVITYFAGSGGSVFLTAGALGGIGTIRANGGSVLSRSPGGGGRISLVVTNAGTDFSLYTGPVQAFGGAPDAGAGTIYRHSAADRRGYGAVLVNNNGLTGYTDVPPSPPNVTNEVEFVTFNITNGATLRLTKDYLLGDIFLQSANARLDLGSKTLTVRSKEHALSPGTVINYGAIVWWPYFPNGTIFRAK